MKTSEIIDNATAAVTRIKIKKGLERMTVKISNSPSIPIQIYLFLLKLFYQPEMGKLGTGNTPI
jgi:hypothetical protein